MQKTIIVLKGTKNIGKTSTLVRVGKKLDKRKNSTTKDDINYPEYRAVFEYLGVKVGIQTFGDHVYVIDEGLNEFDKYPCDILIMASKGYGDTTMAIENYAKRGGYRVFWGTPWNCTDTTQLNALNDYNADICLKMLDDIINGIL